LSPHVELMNGSVLILVSADVAGFPGDAACCDFLAYFVDKVVVGLLGDVILVFEDGCDSGFAVTAEFDRPFKNVVKGSKGVDYNDKSKNFSQFAAVWVDLIWMARSDVRAEYSEEAAITGLNNESCGAKMILVRSVVDGNCVAAEKCLCYVSAMIWAVEMSDFPLVVFCDVSFNSQR
jgi:hypothetical protein